jgi:hypothetical protein
MHAPGSLHQRVVLGLLQSGISVVVVIRVWDFMDAVIGSSCCVRVKTRVNVKNLDRSRQSFVGPTAGIGLFLRNLDIGDYLLRLFYKKAIPGLNKFKL